MKIPKIFMPEKDLDNKVNELVMPKEMFGGGLVIEAEEFYASSVDDALKSLFKGNYEALFMPSIVDMRVEASKNATIWKNCYCTPSIMVTGSTKQGNTVVVYAHVPNYFSNPDSIREAKKKESVNGARIMPNQEFQRLLDLEDDKNVFVIDYKTIRKSKSGVIRLESALRHPQTIPFLGGRERAEKYLDRCEAVYGKKIGIWYSDDIHDKPIWRLLFIGNDYYAGLYGGCLTDDGCFVGACNSPVGATRKIVLAQDI